MDHRILDYQKRDYKVKAIEEKMIQIKASLEESEPIYELNNLELDLQNKETYIQVCQMKLERMNDKIRKKQQESIPEDELLQYFKQRTELEHLIDGDTKDLKILQEKHRKLSTTYNNTINKLVEEKKQLETDRIRLSEEMDELSRAIAHDELLTYERAKQKLRKPFAYVKSGACSVCHIQVPSSREQKIAHQDIYCDNCGRLFVAKVDK